MHGAHGTHQVLGVRVLEHEPARPAPQGPPDVVVDVEGGHDEHAHLGVRRGDLLGGGQAVPAGHLHVHEDDLGAQGRDGQDGRGPVAGVPDDVDPARRREHRAEAGPDDRLVVDEHGHSVVILDSLLPQVHGDSPKLDLPDCEIIQADVRDPEAVGSAMEHIDVVYHLAAETGVGQSQYEIKRYVSTNTYGTSVVLEAAVMAKVGQVLIASSRAVYGEGQQRCSKCNQRFNTAGRQAADLDAGRWDLLCPECNGVVEPTPMHEDAATVPSSIYGITKLSRNSWHSVWAARMIYQ